MGWWVVLCGATLRTVDGQRCALAASSLLDQCVVWPDCRSLAKRAWTNERTCYMQVTTTWKFVDKFLSRVRFTHGAGYAGPLAGCTTLQAAWLLAQVLHACLPPLPPNAAG